MPLSFAYLHRRPARKNSPGSTRLCPQRNRAVELVKKRKCYFPSGSRRDKISRQQEYPTALGSKQSHLVADRQSMELHFRPYDSQWSNSLYGRAFWATASLSWPVGDSTTNNLRATWTLGWSYLVWPATMSISEAPSQRRWLDDFPPPILIRLSQVSLPRRPGPELPLGSLICASCGPRKTFHVGPAGEPRRRFSVMSTRGAHFARGKRVRSPRVLPDQTQQDIAARVRMGESKQAVAAAYGVNLETVAQVMRAQE